MDSNQKKNYKLREDLSIELFGKKLFRIEATKDIEKYGVKTGDIGGYIEKEYNLSGNAWVYGNARVSGNARVYGDAEVSGNAWVYGNARVSGNARVYGDAKIEKPKDCKNIINEKYNITILPESIKIGCQMHTKKEWWGFTDREILAMDGKDGLLWWKKWKPILMAICAEEKSEEA